MATTTSQPGTFDMKAAERFAALWAGWDNGFRDYSAATTRYVESDPIGLAGGMNTYQYVGGNPYKYVDPQGTVESFNPWDIFNPDGTLSPFGQNMSTPIIPSSQIGNPAIPAGYSKWVTYNYCPTPSNNIQYQTHYYRSDATGEPWYGRDYKSVRSGPGSNQVEPAPEILPDSAPEFPDIPPLSTVVE